jgi:hypothetical protein
MKEISGTVCRRLQGKTSGAGDQRVRLQGLAGQDWKSRGWQQQTAGRHRRGQRAPQQLRSRRSCCARSRDRALARVARGHVARNDCARAHRSCARARNDCARAVARRAARTMKRPSGSGGSATSSPSPLSRCSRASSASTARPPAAAAAAAGSAAQCGAPDGQEEGLPSAPMAPAAALSCSVGMAKTSICGRWGVARWWVVSGAVLAGFPASSSWGGGDSDLCFTCGAHFGQRASADGDIDRGDFVFIKYVRVWRNHQDA